ncbi:VOC family protein [Bacillaceae bacterium C204]|uniref:VOC family protein n=1 Tax=Neobacillus sp. 204 TaxID=3383351 RepID=UPI003978B35D
MTLRLTPCIVMDGNAKEAVRFYEKVLEAKVLNLQTYGDMPIPCPEALKERVANAILRIGESELMLFDAPNLPVPDGNNESDQEQVLTTHHNGNSVVTINISINDVGKTKQIFGILQQGGKVIAPLEEVPFSPAFGTVKDKFGVTFILVTQV